MGTVDGYHPENTENPEHLRHERPTNPPRYAPDEQPTRCYEINTDYIPALLSVLDYFVHPDAFVGTLPERELAAKRFTELQYILMAGNLECGEVDGMRLRQKPTDDCVLQASYDLGVTWEDVFDYGACFAKTANETPIINVTAIADAQVVVQEAQELYQTDPQLGTIAPDMVMDLTAEDNERNAVICEIIESIVRTVSGAALAYLDKADNWYNDVTRFLVDFNYYIVFPIFWVVDLFGKTVKVPDALFLAVWEHMYSKERELIRLQEVAGFDDEGLMNLMICYAYERVFNQSITQVEYAGMFAGVSGLEGVTYDMEQWLTLAVEAEEEYTAAMVTMNALMTGLSGIKTGEGCPCFEWAHDVTLEFEADPDPTGEGAAFNTNYNGGWVCAEGKGATEGDYRMSCQIKLDMPSTVITGVWVEDYDAEFHTTNLMRIRAGVDWTDYVVGGGEFQDGVGIKLDISGFTVAVTRVMIDLVVSETDDITTLGGSGKVKKIILTGRGPDHFDHLPDYVL